MTNEILSGSCHCEATGWTLSGDPGGITACNCTLCRRYGTLRAYDYENERIKTRGATRTYVRKGKERPSLEIHFCPVCACVTHWRGLDVDENGRRRIAVNVRLAPPDAVAHLPSTTSTASMRSTTGRATVAACATCGSRRLCPIRSGELAAHPFRPMTGSRHV